MARKILTTLDLIAPLTLSGATGTSGQVLISGGSGVIPSWSNIATTYGLTVGTNGLTMTSGSSPWTGSAAATIDIDTTKIPLLTSVTYVGTTSIALNRTSANLALTGITSITGGTGTTNITLNSAAVTGAASGAIDLITGATTTSGTTGAVTVRSGNSAGASGASTISTGTSTGTTSGTLTLSTGAVASGTGNSGALSIITGAAGTTGNSGNITMDVGTKTTGTFGTITIGGTSASAVTIGNVTNTATTTIAASTTLNLNVPTIATNVTAGTVALFNTGLTGTLNIGALATAITIGSTTAASATYRFADGASTTGGAKSIYIGANGAAASTTNVYIGSDVATASNTLRIMGQVSLGPSRSSSTTVSGVGIGINGSDASNTGASGNATGGDVSIYSGAAATTGASIGTATSGKLSLDAGSATSANGGIATGVVAIGEFNASGITLGSLSALPTLAPTPITMKGSFAVGTSSLPAYKLASGGTTLLTTPAAGSFEYTTAGLFFTPAVGTATTGSTVTGRGLVPSVQTYVVNSDATIVSVGSGATATGNIMNGKSSWLLASTTYEIDAVFYTETAAVTANATTHQLAFTFPTGASAYISVMYTTPTSHTAQNTTVAWQAVTDVAGTVTGSPATIDTTITAGTTVYHRYHVKGTIKNSSTAGYWQMTLNLTGGVGGTGTVKVKAGSYTKVTPVGLSAADVNVGPWT